MPVFYAMVFFCVILIGLLENIWWILALGIVGFLYQFYWVWKNSPWR
jgi:hypothetical protein